MNGALVALCLAASAVAEPAPIGGAFGITFGSPVLKAALRPMPAARVAPVLLEGFAAVDAPIHLQPQWFDTEPLLPLEVLRATSPTYLVQTDEQLQPLRIRVETRPADGCARQQRELADLLAVKYASNSAPWIEGAVQYADADRRATLICEAGTVVLEYEDRAAYAAWYGRWQDAVVQWDAAEVRRTKLAFADRVTLGSDKSLDGMLGITLRSAYEGFDGALADVPLPTPPPMEPPLPVGKMTVVLDPAQVPYEIRAELVFADEARAAGALDELRKALRQKYGVAARDVPDHLVFNIGGDLLAVRRIDPTHVALTAVRQSGLQNQRIRKREALARAAASNRAGWDSTLRGL